MDVLIWTIESTEIFAINIADSIVNVPVIFIDSLVSLGWEEYATFGNLHPGGWSGPDTLHCVKKEYDINSENFKVSYLVHEVQHLLDHKTFIHLSGWIPEYRAKLAELSIADTTYYTLIDAFIKGAKNDSRLTHPYGEYKVIGDLSVKIFQEKYVGDIKKWKTIPFTEINIAARKLLKQNSMVLTIKK